MATRTKSLGTRLGAWLRAEGAIYLEGTERIGRDFIGYPKGRSRDINL